VQPLGYIDSAVPACSVLIAVAEQTQVYAHFMRREDSAPRFPEVSIDRE
jgi:hypothetical protein